MGESYELREKDLRYRRRIWDTGEGFGIEEKDLGYERRMLGLQEDPGAMKQGYWGFWKTLGLLEDSGASEEGQWSYRRILELQTTDAGAAGGFWGFRRTLGLQEKDTGIQPCNQHPPHTTSPWGLSGHKENGVGSRECPRQPQGEGWIPRTLQCHRLGCIQHHGQDWSVFASLCSSLP